MIPFVVLHTAARLTELTNTPRSIGGTIRVVVEHTGNVLLAPYRFGPEGSRLFVALVNAILSHDFSDNLFERSKRAEPTLSK